MAYICLVKSITPHEWFAYVLAFVSGMVFAGLYNSTLILQNQKRILMNQAELAAELAVVTTQVAKIGEESKVTIAKVAELQAAVDAANAAGNTVAPEVVAALDALKAQVNVVDALIPDAPAA